MAKKIQNKQKQEKEVSLAEGRTCSECANAYDWHSPAVDGHMTLARCPYRRWCVISCQKACDEHFKPLKREGAKW